MRLTMYQVDAFTRSVFGGNPAAVVPLESWLEDECLQAIAAENNLSETAFFVPADGGFQLRWFTPVQEVPLCGHATLASAHVVLELLDPGREGVDFHTGRGILRVARGDGGRLSMTFPRYMPAPCEAPGTLLAGLKATPERVLRTAEDKNLYAVFEDEAAVRGLAPDMNLLASLHPHGVSVTAPGDKVDFVSRYFVPSYGIPEDPVTGSMHCALIPYWADRLGKRALHARQVSRRGGELFCEDLGDAVQISGHATLFFTGEIFI